MRNNAFDVVSDDRQEKGHGIFAIRRGNSCRLNRIKSIAQDKPISVEQLITPVQQGYSAKEALQHLKKHCRHKKIEKIKKNVRIEDGSSNSVGPKKRGSTLQRRKNMKALH